MRKSILVLGFVLGLSLAGSLNAQMRVYNADLLKFGNVNTSPTLITGMEIDMSEFLFRGKRARFIINGATLELKATPRTLSSSLAENTKTGPVASLVCDEDVSIGNVSSPLYSVHADNFYSSRGIATTSDSRYKANIENMSSALGKIMQLRPVRFDYRKEKGGAIDSAHMNCVGLIAQELKDVVPEAVQYLSDGDIYMVDYTTLIPFLIKTVQEQQLRIEAMESEIQTLKTDK